MSEANDILHPETKNVGSGNKVNDIGKKESMLGEYGKNGGDILNPNEEKGE